MNPKVPKTPESTQSSAEALRSSGEPLQMIIVGAGMSGLCMAIQAKKAGIQKFCVLEKSSDLGGTWLNNRYPGAHCDVPSHLYSFSFAPKANWSEKFASAKEIHAYMHECAERFKLYPNFEFNTAVIAARFDQSSKLWRVTTSDERTLQSQFLVLSTAPLNEPNFPAIAGIEAFKGSIFHTAQWPVGLDCTGKHIGVIGSAASAVQLIPQLAQQAASVTVYQRTPNWILPRGNVKYGAGRLKLFDSTLIRKIYRGFLFSLHESNRLGFSRGSWFADRAAGLAAWLAKRHLYAQVSDESLRKTLSPKYNFGCKRVLVSDDFYPSLSKPNVVLVTDPIQSVDPNGIKTANGRQLQHDVIVCATGFKLDHMAYAVDVRGLDGISIQSQFSDGPQAYLGTMVTKMPNLFLLLGPNTATGHTSTLLYIEAQVQMSLKLLQALASEGKSSLVVKQSIFDQHNEQLQKRFLSTSWSGSCSSWYKIGQGRNIVIWPGSTRQFWKSLAAVRLNDFDLA